MPETKKHASAGAARIAKHRARTARLDRQLPVETMDKLQQLAKEQNKTVVGILIELIDEASKK